MVQGFGGIDGFKRLRFRRSKFFVEIRFLGFEVFGLSGFEGIKVL